MASTKKTPAAARLANPRQGFYSMGAWTHPVPISLFAENRRRLCEALKASGKLPAGQNVVLLQGGGDQGICDGDSSDVGPNFKQEGYFHWTFGALEPDCYGALDVANGRSALFVPKLPQEYAVWMGEIESKEKCRERYGVDDVHYVQDMADALKAMGQPTLLTLHGANTDSGKTARAAAFDGMAAFSKNEEVLFPVITELRTIKTEAEIDVMRFAARVSSDAHMAVMKNLRPGMSEYQCESTFLNHCYFYGGARNTCYTPIAGAGHSASVLHYGHAGAANDQIVKDGDMVLFDMGCEYYRYCSDITCSYPANGKFTDDQALVYNAVMRARQAVLDAAKPGKIADITLLFLLRDTHVLKPIQASLGRTCTCWPTRPHWRRSSRASS